MRKLFNYFPFFILLLFTQIAYGDCSCLREKTANWMGDHKEELGIIPLKNLAIPGTHNSATNEITSQSPYAPNIELPEWLQKLSGFWMDKFGSSFTKEITARWAKTQDHSITDQLLDGIRYFDLRLCFNEEDGGIYSCHGLISQNIFDILKEIKEFSLGHPDEILFLDFRKFSGLDDNQLMVLSHAIISQLGELLLPNRYDGNTRPKQIWNSPHRIIALFHNSNITQEFHQFWDGGGIVHVWPDARSNEELDNNLTEGLRTRRYNSRLFVSSGVFTPNSDTVLDGIIGNPFSSGKTPDSIEELAETVNPIIIELLDKWKNEGLINNVNILTVDWYHNSDIVERVINLNLINPL